MNARRNDQPEDTEAEEIIKAAAIHVTRAINMRGFIKKRMMEAKADAIDNTIDHKDRQYVLVIDFAQNMGLPHFGAEQPGATYYFSPINVYCFGIADESRADKAHLFAHCYMEGDAKKGGDNVASLLIHFMEKREFLKRGENNIPVWGKRLTIAADNCAGQNMNNHVIRLVAYLVECGYNNMLKVLARSDSVTVDDCSKNQFFCWNRYLSEGYNKVESGEIHWNHVFRCTYKEGVDSSATTLIIKSDEGTPETDNPTCEAIRSVKKQDLAMKSMAKNNARHG